jgi:hypothetical protein
MQASTSVWRYDHCRLVLKNVSNLEASMAMVTMYSSDRCIWEKPEERIRIDGALQKSEADGRNEDGK